MADGSVFIFNCSPLQISLAINNNPLQGSMLPAVVTSQPPYVPKQLNVTRYNNGMAPAGQAVFFNDFTNVTIVQWLGRSTQNSNPVNLYIPISSNPTPDLWLYLFHNCLVLFDTVGRQLACEPIFWSTTVTQNENEAEQASVQGQLRYGD